MRYLDQAKKILESTRILLSNIKPSEWAEKHRVMTSDVSPFPGRFSYKKTPYLREVVDCISSNHPSRIIAIMKGAQVGFSTGVIEAGIGYIISQQPGNILFLTGHSELAEEAMNGKIDQLIDSCGLRPLIRPNVLRAKNMRTGDTNKSKEFPGGSLVAGSANNHKLLRQRSVRYGFIDDFEAVKSTSKESGATTRMIEQRFAAYYDKMKLFYISTPELKQTTNIEGVYEKGDQRKFHIPCPCCGEYIPLEWSIEVEGRPNEMGGIAYKLDENNKLINDSVGYICQKCGDFFDDSLKYEFNFKGMWIPTAEPSEEGYYSYHLSSLYAPPGMYDWKHYVGMYLEACPPNGERKESLYKTFVNLCLGQTYELNTESIKANQLQKNIRRYEIGEIPEQMSIDDGNGKIIFLTCAIDMGGKVEDGRLDYEVVAWSETGSSYSITQGAIGTFIPMEGNMKFKVDRERYTYEHNKPNSVWPILEGILNTAFSTDTGRKMPISITAIDTGFFTNYAYTFIDTTNCNVVGIKGKDTAEYLKVTKDANIFKYAIERPKLFVLEVHLIKDKIAEMINLKYDQYNDRIQPQGFMNYPTPSGGKYLYDSFFAHYEAEEKQFEIKDGAGIAFRWKKKSSAHQNHFFDVRVYNYAVREIFVDYFSKINKKKLTYAELASLFAVAIK